MVVAAPECPPGKPLVARSWSQGRGLAFPTIPHFAPLAGHASTRESAVKHDFAATSAACDDALVADHPDDTRPAKRRDAEGRLQAGRSWETLIDRQIREAMEAGKFDDLPHQGRPLPNDENPLAGDWGLAFHVLRNAGFAPPWIEADKEVRALLAERDALLARAATGSPSVLARRRDRASLEDLVRRINAAVARINAEAPTPRQHRRPLDLAAELARYDAACGR